MKPPVFVAAVAVGVAVLPSQGAPSRLSWAPPALKDPVTKSIGPARSSIKLDTTKDYILKLPANEPYIGELNIYGGSNVVIIGGTVKIPTDEEGYTASKRAVYLHGQTGTIHVEGLRITGNGLHEGFNLDERNPNCVVQLQNIHCDYLHGSYSENHADMIQTWAGPNVLRLDRFTGYSQYQGFFMLPNQHFTVEGDGAFVPKDWDFRHVNLMGDTSTSAYMFWTQDGDMQPAVRLHDVWARPKSSNAGNRNQYLWPKNDVVWSGVREGVPPGGDFVDKNLPGYGYVSPGYRATRIADWAEEFGGAEAFAKKLPVTVAYAQGAGIADFPVLVRLSTAIPGFSYADFKASEGHDLLFATEDGEVLPYDVDTWNTSGESLVWVRIPSLEKNSVFYAYIGNARVDYPAPAAEVWQAHAGVWHLGEDFAAKAAQNQKRAFDAAGNGLDAYGRDSTSNNAYLAEMVPAEGRIGVGRRNQTSSAKPGVCLSTESYDRLGLGSKFTFSGWYKANSLSGYPRPVSRKNNYSDKGGWEVQVNNGSATEMSARGSGSTAVKIVYPKAFNSGWHHYAWVYDGTSLTAYQDGAKVGEGTISAAADNGLPLSFGGNANGSEQSWSGDYDELRLRRGASGAAAVAAEYATMSDASFLAYGSVVENRPEVPVEDPGVRYVSTSGSDANNGFTSDSPLRTLDRAIRSLDARGGGRVYVSPGTYTESSRHTTVSSLNTNPVTKEDSCLVVTNAITVTGLGDDPSKTVVTKQGSIYARIFYLNHAGAKIENLTIKGGKIDGNSGKGSDGGNVWIGAAGGWIDNCVISGGDASWTFGMAGGNVYMAGGRVSRCRLAGGKAATRSGQQHYGASVSMTGGVLENCLVTGSSCSLGAAVWAKGGAKVVNCTVADNSCRTASGVHAEEGASVVNTAIFGNTAAEASSAADVLPDAFTACAAEFAINPTCLRINATAFADATGGDYSASEGSLLVDAGAKYATTGAASATDLAGGARVRGNGVDIGCYESARAAVASRIRYVSPSGDDGSSGVTSSAPLRSLAVALQAVDRLGGGEVRLAPGVYEPDAALETVSWNDHSDVRAANTCYVLTNAITVAGQTGNPGDVVIRRPATVGSAEFFARVFLIDHPEAKISGVTVADGCPATGNGGNVYIGASGGAIEDCTLESGDATKSWGMAGGNLFMRAGRVVRTVIRGGRCRDGSGQWAWGGGVAMGGGVLDSCLVVGNSCARGASVWARGDAQVVNCTVAGNTGKYIAGIHAESGCRVRNCAIFGNVAASDTTGTQHVWHKDASAFSHCAAEVAVNGTCIALESPGFADAANGDYRPVFGSRLVDAGCEISLAPPASATDIAGLARVSGPAVDIGCHEFVQDGTPVLSFTCDRQEAVVGEPVAFTAQFAGLAGDYVCAWDFDGDGRTDASIANAATATWSYAAAGVRTVSLAVTAGDQTARATRAACVTVCTAAERWLAAAGGIDGFEKRFRFTLVSDCTGSPLPVRLSPSIYGFSYDDFSTFGNDLVFTDAEGNVVPHDIETWHVGGTSLVWVKFPPSPAGTVFYAYYGNAGVVAPPPDSDFRDAVWRDFPGGRAAVPDSAADAVLARYATDANTEGYTWTGGLVDVPAGQTLVIERLIVELPEDDTEIVCGKTGGGTLVLAGDEAFDWTNRFFFVESGEVVLANTSGHPVAGALRMSGGKVTFAAPDQVVVDNSVRPCDGAVWYLGGDSVLDLAGYRQEVLRMHFGAWEWNGKAASPWRGRILGTQNLKLGIANTGDDRFAGVLEVHPEAAGAAVFEDGLSTLNGRYGTHFVRVADIPGVGEELVFDGPYFEGRSGNGGTNVRIDGYGDGTEKTYGAVSFNAATTWGNRGTVSIYATVYANAQEGSSLGALTNVTVGATGRLGGNGIVGTFGETVPVVVQGTLAPGNPSDPAGRLSVGADGKVAHVEMREASAFSVTLGGGSASSVAATGKFKIAQGARLEVCAKSTMQAGRYRVVEAALGVEGAFASAVCPDGFTAALEYGGKNGAGWIDLVVEEKPVLYDPSGAAITDAAVLGWLEGIGAGQSDISALTQRGFGDAYLLNIDITKAASGETGGRLAVAGIAVSGGKVVVEVALSRKEGGREVGVRRINGSLRLLGAASLDEDFKTLAEADISNADFSGGNTASAEFDIGKNADSMFLSAAIE